MKKIALIAVLNEREPYHNLGIHLGPLSLEAYLSKHGYKCCIMEKTSDAFLIKPDIVGISSVTETYDMAIDMAYFIKERLRVPIIIGGTHISGLPESLHQVFSAGVVGEGEETFLELLRAY